MQRSKIALLPEPIRLQLDSRIQAGGFSGYQAVTDWLTEQCREAGIPEDAVPSKSAVHKHGQQLEDIYSEILLEAQRSKAFGQAIADQQNEYGLAVLRKSLYRADRLVERIEESIDRGEIHPDSIAKSIAPLLQVMSQLNRALVTVEKFADQVRERAAEVAQEVDTTVRSAGLTPAACEEIKRKILGIA